MRQWGPKSRNYVLLKCMFWSSSNDKEYCMGWAVCLLSIWMLVLCPLYLIAHSDPLFSPHQFSLLEIMETHSEVSETDDGFVWNLPGTYFSAGIKGLIQKHPYRKGQRTESNVSEDKVCIRMNNHGGFRTAVLGQGWFSPFCPTQGNVWRHSWLLQLWQGSLLASCG